jgi:alkanesulfonate monooxygenase SsuD/methylene tetrahydromethanopterin reductase-like flavin-dependent oxidoreductase (luciferase family)
MTMPPVGLVIATSTPPEQIAALARRVEELGYSEVWVGEDYFCYGGIAAAGVALAATERIKVGVGVMASAVRHPAVTAMEIATLARCYPGRFLPGIGHGLPLWVDQMGLVPKSWLSTLTECVSAVRALLAGETLEVTGKTFTFKSVALTNPPNEQVPILTGALGPKSLQLSGRIADGTVMSVLSGAKCVTVALANIGKGMQESGRTSHLLPTFALFSCKTDRTAARRSVRGSMAHYLSVVEPHNPLTQPYGYGDALAEMAGRGGAEAIEQDMPEEWVDELTVSGNPDDVAAAIDRLLDSGVTSVVLFPADSAAVEQELELVANTVLPRYTETS